MTISLPPLPLDLYASAPTTNVIKQSVKRPKPSSKTNGKFQSPRNKKKINNS